MEQSKYTNLSPSYDEIHNACLAFAQRISTSFPGVKYIVGVSRGGLIPAVILSHMTNTKLRIAEYSSAAGKGDDKNHANYLPFFESGTKLVIVDDICDTGNTLNEIVAHYTQRGVVAHTAVLYYKTLPEQKIVPDMWWKSIPHDSGWVIFPFERKEVL